jgi:C4-dicarboxylate transporter DctM subunit
MRTSVQGLGGHLASMIDRICILSGTVAGMAMFVVAMNTTYEVIRRRIFDSPTTWVFSVSLFVMVWFVLLAGPFGVKERKQIEVDFLILHLSERTRSMLGIATYIISLVFIIVMGYYGSQMCLDAYVKGITSLDLLVYPQWILYLIFPLASVLYGLQMVRIIVSDVMQLMRGQLAKKVGWKDSPRFILPLFVVLIGFGVYLFKVSPFGAILFLALCLLFAGVPVSFALGGSGIVGLFLIYRGSIGLSMVPVVIETTLHNFVLLAIPMFIMGGVILYKCGLGERVYDMASKWMSGLPGGLAVGTVIACGIFSAMVGVSAAVAAAIGMTAIPTLISRGYSKELAYGTVAGGALGVLIPPSAGLIVYGFLTDSSVGTLFMAAFIPGFMIVMMFSIYTSFYCWVKGSGKYEEISASWKERMLTVKSALLGLFAPVFVLAGIYSGVFTPTEAAGVFVIYSMVVALIYRKMNWTSFIAVTKESAIIASMIMMVMIGAMVMTDVVSHLRITRFIAQWIATANIPHWLILASLTVLYLILGMFLDGLSITVLTIPVLFPLLPSLGLDVIVFGVILMMFVEAALLTPPVGMNLYVVKTITGDSLWPIVKGNIPFAAILFLGAVVLFLFPEIALWLPRVLE